MSFTSDIISALSGVASGRVYPHVAPEGSAYPLVNYRILGAEPIVTIDGTLHATDYQVAFECWGTTYASALDTAAAVRAAIAASSMRYARIAESGEEYDPPADSYMEPVYFEFTYP
jgi:hypothetical protein